MSDEKRIDQEKPRQPDAELAEDLEPASDEADEVKGGMNKSELIQQLANRTK